jgi:hypothetical protein
VGCCRGQGWCWLATGNTTLHHAGWPLRREPPQQVACAQLAGNWNAAPGTRQRCNRQQFGSAAVAA